MDADRPGPIRLFLCGDVMTGRGVDQILPHPGAPGLRERSVRDARTYIELAEAAHGPVPAPVDFSYIWGDALGELERAAPDARIANLETSVTRSEDFWPGKGIHYRMHPDNVSCLTAARLDVCALANNHVLDFGPAGLRETLETLERAGLRTAGAGRDIDEARRPARVELVGGRTIFVFSLGTETSGVPSGWAATKARPGVDVLADLSETSAAELEERVRRVKRGGDVVVASIHWGDNWGYEVPREHVRFAHRLIAAGVDVVHGHSSHHPRPIEIHEGRLILYGCGDCITDYEGIGGYEAFRGDLVLLYFVTLDPISGALVELRMVPLQIRRVRLAHASPADARWLRDVLLRISACFGSQIDLAEDGRTLMLRRG